MSSRNLFVLGALALVLMLAFGCAGNQPAQNAPSTQASSAGQASGSNIRLGDSDISQASEPNENQLSTQDIVAPDNATVTAPASAGTSPNLSDSDLGISNDSNDDIISQGDVVEPG